MMQPPPTFSERRGAHIIPVVPRVGNRITYEMPRSKQVSGGVATVEGRVHSVSITYREKSALVEVRLLDTTIEYVS